MPVDDNLKNTACVEQHRLFQIENAHEALRDDIREIRDGFSLLTKELHAIGIDLRGFSALAQGIVLRFEDRDKQYAEQQVNTRDTFHRLGTKIDNLEERVRLTESDRAKLVTIERVISGFFAVNKTTPAHQCHQPSTT